MKIKSITFKGVLLITAAFLITAVSVIVVADYQLRTIIDRNQAKIHSEKLEIIIASLDRKYQGLQDTLLIEAYEEEFKQSFLTAFRNDYYAQNESLVYPFIVDDKGGFVAHPLFERGDDSLADLDFSRRLVTDKEGSFEYVFNRQEHWVIFKYFEGWNWIVGYTVPLEVKYADARLFRNILILTMAVITTFVLVALSMIITKYTQLITRLTEASAEIASGNLEYPIEISGTDELGILARSFTYMRDSIRQKITDLAEKNEQLLLEITERKRVEDLIRAQRDLALKLGATVGLDETLRLCVEAAIDGARMDVGALYLVDEISGELNLAYSTGLSPDFVKAASHYDVDSANTRLVMAGKPLYINYQDLDVPLSETERREGLRVIAVLPIHHEGQVIACWNLASRSLEQFPATARNTLETIAAQIGSVVARSRAEEAVRESEANYREIFDVVTDAILIHDRNTGRLVDVNRRACEMYGFTAGEMKEIDPGLLNASGKLPHTDPNIEKKLVKMSAGESLMFEWLARDRNGRHFWVEVNLKRATIGGKDRILAIVRDIDERRRLEEQLRQAQKMEAIGRLAGGVAHDFNNLLTAMMGYTGLALETLSPNDPLRHDIEGIQKTAERATNLTRQLLAFARKQIIHPTVLNPNDLILNVDKMLRRFIGEDIELVTLPTPDLGWVKADPGQIEQVLVNLVVNARDAMPNGGKLTIETANVTLDEDYANQHPEVTPGEYVMLTVSDTGTGMTEEVKANLFEPFFTTKEAEKGSGLGLAICFGIVKQSDGHIWVYSEPGQGTTFKIYLPRLDETMSPVLGRDQADDLSRGTETVLLVEDEPAVRQIAIRILRDRGYNVLEAANGDEALHIAREHAEEEIHLLLTDMVMPRLGGGELADRLKLIYPEIKVLFISGYTDNVTIHHGVLEPGIAFLQKPFTPNDLTRKVREVLGREANEKTRD